jgi:teichoic acid transport system permease protein
MSTTAPADQPADGLFPVGQSTPLGEYLRELWVRRDYIVRVPLADLRSQNAHTLLGGIWLVLNPLLQVGVYFLVFGVIMPIDRGVDSYLVFLTIGVFAFHYSQRVISDGARSVVSSMGLIRTLRFPRATLPLSNSVGQAVAFGPVFAVMLVVVLAHGNTPTVRWLLLPALFGLQTLFSLGASLLAARFNHLYRDLENLLPFVFRLLFYVSGVLYSVDHYVDDALLRGLFALNPMYVYVTAWRWVMVGGPATAVEGLAAVAWALVTLVVGFAVFRAGENTYGRTG